MPCVKIIQPDALITLLPGKFLSDLVVGTVTLRGVPAAEAGEYFFAKREKVLSRDNLTGSVCDDPCAAKIIGG